MYLTFTVLAAGAIVLVWYALAYNELVAARNAVDQSWSNVDVELERRFDLIGNLVEVVKGYARHERTALERITALRGQPGRLATAADGNTAQRTMAQALGGLMALVEAYPDLKANAQFRDLQGELITTENRIAERRGAYNQTVTLYQNRCESVPSSLVASLHGFEPRAFFDAPDALAAVAPAVELS